MTAPRRAMKAPSLYRILGRKIVHLAACRCVADRDRIHWVGAEGRTVDEVRQALADQDGSECSICRPLSMAVIS